MLTPINAHSARLRSFLLIALLFITGTVILARWNARGRVSADDGSWQQGQRSADQLEAEVVTITPTGFEPGEITRPEGRFILAIDNRSGLNEVQLYMERDTGARLSTSPTRKSKLAWRDVIDFPSGTYILRATNDERWHCRITLTPR